MRITKKQLRRIIKEERAKLLREAPAGGMILIPEGTELHKLAMKFVDKGTIEVEEANGGMWITSISGYKHYIDIGKDSWRYRDRDVPVSAQTIYGYAKETAPYVEWLKTAKALRAGKLPPNDLITNFTNGRSWKIDFNTALGILLGAPTSIDASGLGPDWDPSPRREKTPEELERQRAFYAARAKAEQVTAPYLESGSVEELMALDDSPEVSGLVADFGALSAAQKLALRKIEDLGQGDASVEDFKALLDQVGKENFVSAAKAVSGALRQIEDGSADELTAFYNDVMGLV